MRAGIHSVASESVFICLEERLTPHLAKTPSAEAGRWLQCAAGEGEAPAEHDGSNEDEQWPLNHESSIKIDAAAAGRVSAAK